MRMIVIALNDCATYHEYSLRLRMHAHVHVDIFWNHLVNVVYIYTRIDPRLSFDACAGIQEAKGRGAKTGAGKQRSIQALPALHEERRTRTDGDGPRIGVTWWRRHVTSSRCLLTAAGVVQSCRPAGRTTVWLTAARTYMSRVRSECLFIRYLCEWVLCGLWVVWMSEICVDGVFQVVLMMLSRCWCTPCNLILDKW